MSIQAIGWVLDHERETQGVPRLVLIVLANYADEHGECYPSVARIASSCCCSERAVQYALGQLEDKGIIKRALNASVDGRIPANKKPNLYRITGVQNLRPRNGQGRNSRQSGVQSATSRGEAGFTQTVIDPSKNRDESGHFAPGSGVMDDYVADAERPWTPPPSGLRDPMKKARA